MVDTNLSRRGLLLGGAATALVSMTGRSEAGSAAGRIGPATRPLNSANEVHGVLPESALPYWRVVRLPTDTRLHTFEDRGVHVFPAGTHLLLPRQDGIKSSQFGYSGQFADNPGTNTYTWQINDRREGGYRGFQFESKVNGQKFPILIPTLIGVTQFSAQLSGLGVKNAVHVIGCDGDIKNNRGSTGWFGWVPPEQETRPGRWPSALPSNEPKVCVPRAGASCPAPAARPLRRLGQSVMNLIVG